MMFTQGQNCLMVQLLEPTSTYKESMTVSDQVAKCVSSYAQAAAPFPNWLSTEMNQISNDEY